MGVLGTLFVGSYAAMGGSKPKPATPPINASSSDEADFIKCAHIPPAFSRAVSLTCS